MVRNFLALSPKITEDTCVLVIRYSSNISRGSVHRTLHSVRHLHVCFSEISTKSFQNGRSKNNDRRTMNEEDDPRTGRASVLTWCFFEDACEEKFLKSLRIEARIGHRYLCLEERKKKRRCQSMTSEDRMSYSIGENRFESMF
jgi:hypothetical protein